MSDSINEGYPLGDIERKNDVEHFSISEMVEGDIASVIALDRAAFPDPYSQEFWGSVVSAPFVQIVKSSDNKVIGVALNLVHGEDTEGEDPDIGGAGEICSILIDPTYRGKKLGEKLFQSSIDYLRGRGSADIYIRTKIDNEVMIRLAKKMGFIAEKIIPGYYDTENDSGDGLLMKLNNTTTDVSI